MEGNASLSPLFAIRQQEKPLAGGPVAKTSYKHANIKYLDSHRPATTNSGREEYVAERLSI